MISILEAARVLQEFEKYSLTEKIADIESKLAGVSSNSLELFYPSLDVTTELLESAITFKRTAGQINVLIHSIGILLSLPKILGKDEVVEYLSLGAGNTGRPFDVEMLILEIITNKSETCKANCGLTKHAPIRRGLH